jgi:hypothetical protein
MDKNIKDKKVGCRVYNENELVFCTNDDIIVFLGACFVKLNNTLACL